MKLDWLWWLLILAALLVSPARGAVPADLSLRLLRDAAIRVQESGGEPDCTLARGSADEIGCYQIKLGAGSPRRATGAPGSSG